MGTAQRVLTVGTAIAPAVGDYYALKAALPERFQANASFALNPVRADAAYRLVGGGSTEPSLFDGGRNGAFIGQPLAEWTAVPGTATATGTKVALYGDFKQYLIADRVGMTLEVIAHLFGGSQRPTGQRGAFAWWRTAAKVLAVEAFRYLEIR